MPIIVTKIIQEPIYKTNRSKNKNRSRNRNRNREPTMKNYKNTNKK
jgi:hypothetical protein